MLNNGNKILRKHDGICKIQFPDTKFVGDYLASLYWYELELVEIANPIEQYLRRITVG